MKTNPAATGYRPNTVRYLAVGVLLALAATACGTDDQTNGDPLSGTRWEMTEVWDGSGLAPAEVTTIGTLVFTDGIAGGFDGCNAYQSTYSLDGDSVSFGEVILPGSACDPAYADQANAFIKAIGATTGFAATADSLKLTDTSGATQLVFRPATQLPLAGVSWQVAWYGAGASPLDGTQISLIFRTDGTLAGIAGCNDYSADYRVDGDQLAIRDLANTEKACLEPDGVMEQESDYLGAIQQTGAFSTSLIGLELLDVDGNPVAEYRFAGRIRT
ncbi:MAG: META domain-containing protein [Acidimicrobiia bacterium]|nr:META domain-containing protein [Acidimicrobiia bacterium]